MAAAAHHELRAELHDTATSRLATFDQRLTRVRRTLVDLLADSGRPLTLPEILAAGVDIAQSSAYRNLTVLEAAGVVHRVVTHDEFARYELAEDLTEHHHHLVCRECGRVEDLPASRALERSVAAAVSAAARATNFRVDQHRLEFIGLCGACVPA